MRISIGYAPDALYTAQIDLSLKSGYEAIDYGEVAKTEHLKPVELEMRKMENILDGVVTELDYMKTREEALRNTNGFIIIIISSTPQYLVFNNKILSSRINIRKSERIQHLLHCPHHLSGSLPDLAH